MKKLVLIIMTFAVAFGGYSQKKPKINKALRALEDGEIAEAKDIIDRAIDYEKTKDDGKTWYYRGLIYATIDTTSNSAVASLSDNAFENAVEAFQKADELGEEGKDYFIASGQGLPITKSQQLDTYYGYYYNKAVAEFQNNEYQNAVDAFRNSYKIIPEDSNAYINAAYAAHNGKLWEEAKTHYRLAIENGVSSPDIYANYVNIVASIDKDNEKALKIIDEGLEKFPNNTDLTKSRVQALINMDKITEAKDDLIAAIAAEPENANLHFTLGVLYEELDESEKAAESYKNAIEVNPEHFESNFNYGVLLINNAQEIIKERNNLGLSNADQKKSKELKPMITKMLEEAMPQWERVLEIKPDEPQAIETLVYIYTQLNMPDKAEAMQARMD